MRRRIRIDLRAVPTDSRCWDCSEPSTHWLDGYTYCQEHVSENLVGRIAQALEQPR